jgi:hypothetical protein
MDKDAIKQYYAHVSIEKAIDALQSLKKEDLRNRYSNVINELKEIEKEFKKDEKDRVWNMTESVEYAYMMARR